MSIDHTTEDQPTVDLDLAYVPRAGIALVPVGDEALAYDETRDVLHHLDPIATVVWGELEVDRPLSATCQALAALFGAPIEQVSSDVAALIQRLLGLGLLVGPGEEAHVIPQPAKPQLDDRPISTDRTLPFAPNPCGDTVTALGWFATDPIERNGWVLGVRTPDQPTRDAVRAALTGWVEGPADVPANVSIRPPAAGESRRDLGQVYAECTLVGRSPDWESLLQVVDRELEGRTFHTRTTEISMQATVLRKSDGMIWLAPISWWFQALNRQSALLAGGVELLGRDLMWQEQGIRISGLDGIHPVNGIYSGFLSEAPIGLVVNEVSRWCTNGEMLDRTSIIEQIAERSTGWEVVPGTLANNPLDI